MNDMNDMIEEHINGFILSNLYDEDNLYEINDNNTNLSLNETNRIDDMYETIIIKPNKKNKSNNNNLYENITIKPNKAFKTSNNALFTDEELDELLNNIE